MINSLLQVSLLCMSMGMGTKKPMPIYNNRQYENTTDQTQTNEFGYEFIGTYDQLTGSTTQYEVSSQDISAEDDYKSQWMYTTYPFNSESIQIECKSFQTAYYQPIYTPQDDLWYYERDRTIHRNFDYADTMYLIKIDGRNKGFNNIRLYYNLISEIELSWNINAAQYGLLEDLAIESRTSIYTTIEDLDSYFNPINPFTNDPDTLFTRFKYGNLKNQATEKIIDGRAANQNVQLYLTANRINYIALFYSWKLNKPYTIWDQMPYDIYGPNGVMVINNSDQGIEITPTNFSGLRTQPTFIEGELVQITGITQEVINIPGLMWDILTMPFAFMSTAFNLTIFPGTPYAINISNLVLAIFGVLVFTFIFRLLIKHR